MQIEYPILVKEFFKIFEIFDFKIFSSSMVPPNKYLMGVPKGFQSEQVDAFLFRNTDQYITLSFSCLGVYAIFKGL